MSKEIKGNQKHLTLDERITIEKGLDVSTSLRRIATDIGKDPSTISKEIQKHRVAKPRNTFNDSKNKCSLFSTCNKRNVCDPETKLCKRKCGSCGRCNSRCPDFVPIDRHCPNLDKAPWVCNGCKKKSGCKNDKMYYRATIAHKEYKTVLIESRVGLNISEEELSDLDATVSPLILQGQTPYMILENHPEIRQCERTIYNYIDSGALSVKNIDLPKKVSYKVRQSHQCVIRDDRIFEGRTYKDYQEFISNYPDTRIVEMDTVVGCEGSHKVLLTLHFCESHFMMAYLLPSKEAKNVSAVFDDLEKAITPFVFNQCFPIILTDRGSEFSNPDSLECGTDNIIRTGIYYCDPMSSWQKPHCEKNHVYLRKIFPKGTNFDRYCQKDINLALSHVNSSCRESLGGHTPFQMAKFMLPKELLEVFGLREVSPDEVNLTASLMKNVGHS